MTVESPGFDAEGETDRLYELSPDAFVEARNALAARLKAAGDKDDAARVKALVRPSVSAWAANQVYWKARPEFDLLLAAGERLQRAQLAGSAAGATLRDAMKARREAMDTALRRAEALLTSAGLAAGPDTLLRLSNTLDALAAEAARPAGARPGRLARDLDPPGFEAFAAMAQAEPSSPHPDERTAMRIAPSGAPASGSTQAAEPVPTAEEERAEERGRLQAALTEAETRLERARQEARESAGALSVAEKRAEAARAELDEARRRVARAEERAALTTEDETAARQKAGRLAAARESADAARDAVLRAQRDVAQE